MLRLHQFGGRRVDFTVDRVVSVPRTLGRGDASGQRGLFSVLKEHRNVELEICHSML
jgi:hypothetical protein